VTIDRLCGSSQQAVQFAAQAVLSGKQEVVIAAGVESMTRVPLELAMPLPLPLPLPLPQQQGLGTGPYPKAILDRYDVKEISQFAGAEMLQRKYGLNKDNRDLFCFESQKRAMIATQAGAFERKILPLEIESADSPAEFRTNDGIRFDAIPEATAGSGCLNRTVAC
jgi:acetyl-CoA C-acetyltransferase